MVNLNSIRDILFDQDGTLIEMDPMWLPDWENAAHQVATRAGQPVLADGMLRNIGCHRTTGTFDPNATLLTGTVLDIIDAWESVLADKAPGDLEPILMKVFADASTRDPVPVTDVKALPGSLRRRGYILGAATNDSTRKMQRMVDHPCLADDLAFHCGADAGHGGKPGPGMAPAFCRETRISPERVLMVGDSIVDALTTRAAVGVSSRVVPKARRQGKPAKSRLSGQLPCCAPNTGGGLRPYGSSGRIVLAERYLTVAGDGIVFSTVQTI